MKTQKQAMQLQSSRGGIDSDKAHKADQNEGTNIDDDPGLIGGTHVVKAHSADETAEAIAERLASEGAI